MWIIVLNRKTEHDKAEEVDTAPCLIKLTVFDTSILNHIYNSSGSGFTLWVHEVQNETVRSGSPIVCRRLYFWGGWTRPELPVLIMQTINQTPKQTIKQTLKKKQRVLKKFENSTSDTVHNPQSVYRLNVTKLFKMSKSDYNRGSRCNLLHLQPDKANHPFIHLFFSRFRCLNFRFSVVQTEQLIEWWACDWNHDPIQRDNCIQWIFITVQTQRCLWVSQFHAISLWAEISVKLEA